MPPASLDSSRRLAVYSYLRPLIEGRRVLEVGSTEGETAGHLLALGARAVVAASGDGAAAERARTRHGRPGITFVGALSPAVLRDAGPYDLVLVPDAAGLLRGQGGLSLAALRGLLGSSGRLVCAAASGDRPGGEGLGFYDVLDALTPHFARVRMFGQTPFAAYGVAEFDDVTGGLRVDSALVDQSAEQPISYLAVAGPDEALALGYALIQVPVEGLTGAAGSAPAESTSALSRRLAEAQGQIDGALRVSRAQTEEIDELRARLRRAGDDRARLDEEVTRLRRALTEADESVVSLTRRTTEGMAALAQRLTSGLRGVAAEEPPPVDVAGEAARASALSDRDERIAALEAERQDLLWRLESAEEQLRRPRPAPAPAAARPAAVNRSSAEDELVARLRAREQALDEYRRAAEAHMDETAGLRDALTEQSAAVSELEEVLAAAERKLEAAEKESARLRQLGAETEDADRQRRSRLAELEGTLLRLQRQAALQAERAPSGDEPGAARIAELERQLGDLRVESERRRSEAEALRAEAQRQGAELERQRSEAQSAATRAATLVHTEEALRSRISELEARVPESDTGRLDAALAEVDRLRVALELSEEQLWDARGRLTAERERLETLERVLDGRSESDSPSTTETQILIADVLSELAALESGLRAEAAHLTAVERTLDEWRAALPADAASPDVAPPVGES